MQARGLSTGGLLWTAMLFVAVECSVARAAPLDGTSELIWQGDLAERMVDGLHTFLDRETAASVERHARHWNRDFSSPEAYAKSIEPNRQHLRTILGVVDERATSFDPIKRRVGVLESEGKRYASLYELRWAALPGVHGEGYVFESRDNPEGSCILIPDANIRPEAIFGIGDNAGEPVNWADHATGVAMSAMDLYVLAPISRDEKYSRVLEKPTGQPHREFIYRQAFEMGRHIIGYEVQKVLAIVDELHRRSRSPNQRRAITVHGQGDGGLIALCAAAIDPRIDEVVVTGYFAPREDVSKQTIDRNVWGLLDEFGDAEIASMIAPRPLTIHYADYPQVAEHSKPNSTPGTLVTPSYDSVDREFERARSLTGIVAQGAIVRLDDTPISTAGFLRWTPLTLDISEVLAVDIHDIPDPEARQRRQVNELVGFTQKVVRESPRTRAKLWDQVDRKSHDTTTYAKSTVELRKKFYDEILGRFDQSLLPVNPRTRQIYDEPKYTGYEVVLDVFPDVFAYGILLVPKDIGPGERRPVVVCQHGLEGRPQDLTEPGSDHKAYHRYAGRLAEMGYITYAPQNPYIGKDRFRSLVRKANPLGKSLWSFIVPQHQQTVNWLASLPMVDPQRIAFYGLSYGGKTAMRVPAVVEGYCLSICSGDFNEWIWKCTSVDWPRSYLATGEYEMPEWNLGNTFNYAEMAGLIAPRPFMVERGHRDGVAPDEWVAYEYAKVRLLYADLKIPERTEIEFFDGPHTINGVGTFNFLSKHLNWPRP